MDIEKIKQITQNAFVTGRMFKDSKIKYSQAVGVYENWIINHIKNNNNELFYYINEGNEVVGFLALSVLKPFKNDFRAGFVDLVCTDFNNRQSGIAKKLLSTAEKFLYKNKIRYFYANTTFDNFPSLSLFIKNDFKPYNSVYELHWWKK